MKHFFYILILLLAMASFAHADTPDTNIINIYDANGNLVTGDGNYYEYNDANQLVRVRQGDQNGAAVAEYFYDYSGQRIKKIENGVTTYYIDKHFEKQIGGTDAGNTSYYFAEEERVAKKDPSGNIYFYHSDHLGGTNAVTDSAGAVVAKTDYMPFGEVKQGSTGNEKYSYTGKEKDKTDLYYFESRYNSPMFKHFTQADVASPDLSDPQDLNRYSYVGNNPMSYVDPDGFKKKKKDKKKKKKKAKLSKREKWMIAHGIDPDKDKTPLKKAKEKLRAKKHVEKHKAEKKRASLRASVVKSATSDKAKDGLTFADKGKAWDDNSNGMTFIKPKSQSNNSKGKINGSSSKRGKDPNNIVIGSGKAVVGMGSFFTGASLMITGAGACVSIVACGPGLTLIVGGIPPLVMGGFEAVEGVGDIISGFTGRENPFDNPLSH